MIEIMSESEICDVFAMLCFQCSISRPAHKWTAKVRVTRVESNTLCYEKSTNIFGELCLAPHTFVELNIDVQSLHGPLQWVVRTSLHFIYGVVVFKTENVENRTEIRRNKGGENICNVLCYDNNSPICVLFLKHRTLQILSIRLNYLVQDVRGPVFLVFLKYKNVNVVLYLFCSFFKIREKYSKNSRQTAYLSLPADVNTFNYHIRTTSNPRVYTENHTAFS